MPRRDGFNRDREPNLPLSLLHEEDLKTPEHDRIMAWLDDNAQAIIARLLSWEGRWPEKVIEAERARVQAEMETRRVEAARRLEEAARVLALAKTRDPVARVQALREEYVAELGRVQALAAWPGLGEPPEVPPGLPVVTQRIWELPISRRGAIVGFIDLKVAYRQALLRTRDQQSEGSACSLPAWTIQVDDDELFFEAKSSVPSLGELVRQLQFYRQALSYGATATFVVVSPDTRLADRLADLGFGFVQVAPLDQALVRLPRVR